MNQQYTIRYTEDDYCFSINGVKIKEKIFNEELSNWSIGERTEVIDTLINCMGEEKNNYKELMMEDLKYLLSMQDDFIFSSILTNEYILKSDNEDAFNEICEELLKLNQEVE